MPEETTIAEGTTPEPAAGGAPAAAPAPDAGKPAEAKPAKPNGNAAPAPEPASEAGAEDDLLTLAEGGKGREDPAPPQDFPDNWRDLVAAGSKKDRKALDRFPSPAALYESWKSANDKIRGGRLVEMPGDDASDEEQAAFRKALGIPEKPEGYFDKLTLPDGKVLGDDDRKAFSAFAEAMHKAGATPAAVSAAVDWELSFQQQQVEHLAEEDAQFRAQSENELRKEYGGDFKRVTSAIGTLLTDVPQETRALLLAARGPDGRKLGDHPAVVRLLAKWAMDMNPAAEMEAPEGNNLQALTDRLGELRKLASNDKSEYWEGPRAKELQAEFQKLLDIRDRVQARQST